MPIDVDAAYRAVRGRDRRFDGQFYVGVRSTGIYCRPSCPARTPKRANVGFYPSAAAAQRAGFRACKRCRPDATPGSPEWNISGDLAARAVRLIADGAIERDGVSGLANRLGYSERQVGRALLAEVGAPALSLARAHRAQTARTLLEATNLTISDIAFAAGFKSIRQFNDTMLDVFASTPTELRRAQGTQSCAVAGGTISLRLAFRSPMNLDASLRFLAGRSIAAVETYDGARYRRTLRLPLGDALACVEPAAGFVRATLLLTDQRDLPAAVARLRRWLDLDADPVAIAETLAEHPVTAALERARPGLRAVGAVDGFEMAIRAVVGQQISVAGARQILATLVQRYGEDCLAASGPNAGLPPAQPLQPGDMAADGAPTRWRLFPRAEVLAEVDPETLPMTRARSRTVVAVAQAIAHGYLDLAPGADRARSRRALLAITGIGAWTADYIQLRAMADPDVFLGTDLAVRRQLSSLNSHSGPNLDPAAIAPWRSYLTHHLWAEYLAQPTWSNS